jgi:hypothetical protein
MKETEINMGKRSKTMENEGKQMEHEGNPRKQCFWLGCASSHLDTQES